MNKSMFISMLLVAGVGLQAQDGFRVGLAYGSMKTTGPATNLAFNFTGVASNQSINSYNYDQPTQTPLTLNLGLVKGDDEFSLSYMDSNKTSTRDLSSATNPYGISVPLGSGISANIHGSQRLKVSTIDLAWKHAFMKSNAGALAFSAGLRSFDISDEFHSVGTSASGAPTQALHAKGKGSGFGLTAGIHSRLNFNDRVWLTSGFTMAQLDTTVKSDQFAVLTTTATTQIPSEDRHESTLQTETYLRLNVNFVRGFDGFVGYEVKNFGNDTAKVINTYTQAGIYTTSGFGLAGFTAGLSYTF
jgi:hypothetical protein